MNRIKLPIHERLGNVPQFPVGVDAVVAEVGTTSRLGFQLLLVFLISSIINFMVAGWTCHIENVAHLKQKYGLGKNANEVIIILEAYCTLRDRGPYPADLCFKESKRGGSELPKQKGP
ncbi:hypothetical protein AgCh_027636 [Apium graveolens]